MDKKQNLATKGLSLPNGTKVRMTREFLNFKKGDIVTRAFSEEDDHMSVRFNLNKNFNFLTDDRWELIEEPKEEPRLPKQGENVQVGKSNGFWYNNLYEFVCFYKNKVLTQDEDGDFCLYDQWRFPQEEVTLSDGNTYLVVDIDGEKILKPKQ